MNVEEMRDKRDALVGEREAVIERIRHLSDALDSVAEFVERDKLDELNLDISILNDEIRLHEAPAPVARALPANERLSALLIRQDEARVERADMVRTREDIVRIADEDGRSDLDVDEDRRFRDLTRGIAELDGEVVARDEEIDKLAALAAIDTEA